MPTTPDSSTSPRDAGAGRPRVVMSRLCRRDQADRAFDLAFWDAVGAEGRFAAAWQMVRETRLMRGEDTDEPRLQRSVLGVRRR